MFTGDTSRGLRSKMEWLLGLLVIADKVIKTYLNEATRLNHAKPFASALVNMATIG